MPDTDDDTAAPTPADMLMRMAELGVRAQSAVLQAEMEALAHLMPGMGAALPHPPATDAEVEGGFDNMPV